jgi:PAS domain S-box-containing protein
MEITQQSDNITRLKELSCYLEELESELAVFFNLSVDLILICHSNGEIIKVNPAWKYWLGWDKQELIGHNCQEFIHPDDSDKTDSIATDLCLRPLKKSFKNRYICKNGTYKTLAWRAICHNNKYYATARVAE